MVCEEGQALLEFLLYQGRIKEYLLNGFPGYKYLLAEFQGVEAHKHSHLFSILCEALAES